MDRPTCTGSRWSATIWRSTRASALAARTVKAFRSASASQLCGSSASPSAAQGKSDVRRRTSEVSVVRSSVLRSLPHHPRNAARPPPRRLDDVLEKTARRRGAVAGPAIGPGPAARLILTGLGASFAFGIRRRFEPAIIAAEAIDRIFERSGFRLDDPGAAHTGHAAARFPGRDHFALEPAHRGRAGGGWI